jgi:hypothetical protein
VKLYAITSFSQLKTFFMMKVGTETQVGESPSSPQSTRSPKDWQHLGDLREREHLHG